MTKPLVAIVGRPNVGKSTFFNKIAGKRISIVEDIPGVTRDRIYADAEWLGHSFSMVDTGGLDMLSEDELMSSIRSQAQLAIETANVILFMVDGRESITSSDYEVADYLRRAGKPVILVVNKVDNPEPPDSVYDFYELGIEKVFVISAANGLGLGDLLDEVISDFPREEQSDEDALKLAVVGRPNVGKSSFVNCVLNEERNIVSDISGTTRDAVDASFVKDGESWVIIDTAGIRRKSRVEDATLERYSVIRAFAAVRRCDVAIIMIDAVSGITEQDVKIAGFVHEEGKPSVVVVNKWDLIEKDTHTVEKYRKKIVADLAFMQYTQIVFVSALTKQRVEKALDYAKAAYESSCLRITTGMLNDCLNEAVQITPPPSDKGRRLKVYYASQVAVRPPTFVIFVNDKTLMHYSYERYLENYFRKTFGFTGTPIRIYLREKKREDKG